MGYQVKLANLVIAINTANSNSVQVGSASVITIYSPATLEGTINIQVSDDDTTFYDLKSGGSNITLGVDACVLLTDVAFEYLRLHSNAAGGEDAARTFKARMKERL